MSDNLDTAQFFWVEGALSTLERLCLSSFLKNGYEVHLYTYGRVSGVPEGVVVKSAEEILPVQSLFLSEGVGSQSYASFADLFRYALLAKRGGWWFDMDVVCLKHGPRPERLLFASTWEGEYGQCATNCVMWCRPGNKYMHELSARAQLIFEQGSFQFGSLGPFLVQQLVRDYGLQANVAPWSDFCPYPWRMVRRLALTDAKAWVKDALRFIKHLIWQLSSSEFRAGYFRPSTRALHLHNEIWKASGLDKNRTYFFLSPIEILKRRYL